MLIMRITYLARISLLLLLLQHFPSSFATITPVTSKVRLWVSRTCPYAARAWIACSECICNKPNIDFELKMVDLANKPDDFNELYAAISPDPIARAKVPIIEDGEFKMIESAVITRYVMRKYGGSENIVGTAADEARNDFFCDLFQATLGTFSRKVLMTTGDSEELTKINADLVAAVNVLDNFFNRHSAVGPFVNGETFSLAEANCAPFIQRLIPTARHYAGIEVLQICREQNAQRLLAWIEATLARPSVADIKVADGDLIAAYDMMKERIKASSASP